MALSPKQKLDLMEETGHFSFALEGKKGKVRRASQGGKPQPIEPPEGEIDDSRELIDSDPHVAESIETLVDYLVGSGYGISPRNVPYTDAEINQKDIAEVKALVETSDFEVKLWRWVKHALSDGVAFLEINWDENEVFKPRLLPPKRMKLQYDEYGEIVGYAMESEGDDDDVEFGKYDVAHLGFWKHPEDDWFMPITKRVIDQANMLVDMELDMARFVATKAYPPVLWKLGSDENEWSKAEINGWLDEVSKIEPDSMMVGPHDVDTEAVGVTSTSADSGAMDLGPTFEHLENRVATGLGLPYFLLNGDSGGRNDAVATMPKYDRRIQRLRSVIRSACEEQILRSLFYHPNPEENEGEIVPRFEFGEHSSEEERLEVDAALKLFNHGFLTREAFAERVGIDPEVELPSEDTLNNEIIPLIQQLSGKGDDINNPEGGSPTDTGGGESAGGEVKTRQNPEDSVDDDSRNKKPVEDSEPT